MLVPPVLNTTMGLYEDLTSISLLSTVLAIWNFPHVLTKTDTKEHYDVILITRMCVAFRSLTHAHLLLLTAPDHVNAPDNLSYYRLSKIPETEESFEQVLARQEEISTKNFTRGRYASLCRGELPKVSKSEPETRTLHETILNKKARG